MCRFVHAQLLKFLFPADRYLVTLNGLSTRLVNLLFHLLCIGLHVVKLNVGVVRVQRVVVIVEVGLLLDQLMMNLIMLVVRGHVYLLL